MTNEVDLAAIEQKIRDLVQYSMSKDRIPGMSVGIVRGDSLIAYYSFGTQRLGTDLSPTPLTISRVASITKTFTATAILQLRDLGKLELDDPLLLHLPDFTVASALHGTLEEVTLRRMMTHYSGLCTEHPLTDWDAPSFVSTDEEITGPLGFGNTRFELDPEQKRLKATGYSPPTPGSDDLREAPYAPLLGIAAAGQLHSNVEDLAKWVSFQFSSGRKNHPSKVLAATTLAEMHRPVYLGDGWNSGQAIAWLLLRRGDLVLHGHGGGIQGFSSNITFDIKSQTGVLMLANIRPAPTPYNLPADITELVIEEIGPVAEQVASDLGDVSQDHASPYLGRYWAEPGAYVDVVFGETGFGLGTPGEGDYSLHGPAELKNDPAVGDQRVFRIASGRGAGELAEFSLDRNGRPESFRLGGFLYKRID